MKSNFCYIILFTIISFLMFNRCECTNFENLIKKGDENNSYQSAFIKEFNEKVGILEKKMVEWGIPNQSLIFRITSYKALKFVNGRIIVGKEIHTDAIEQNGKNLLVHQNFRTKKILYPKLDYITEIVINKWLLTPKYY